MLASQQGIGIMMKMLVPAAAAGLLVVLFFWKSRRTPTVSTPTDLQQQVRREWRRPPRAPLSVKVEIAGYKHTVTGVSKNIAVGGMLLTPDGQLSVGEPVHVTFTLPDGTAIAIAGAVCRLQAGDVAIRFDATDRQRLLIERWVESVI